MSWFDFISIALTKTYCYAVGFFVYIIHIPFTVTFVTD